MSNIKRMIKDVASGKKTVEEAVAVEGADDNPDVNRKKVLDQTEVINSLIKEMVPSMEKLAKELDKLQDMLGG